MSKSYKIIEPEQSYKSHQRVASDKIDKNEEDSYDEEVQEAYE